MSLVRVNRITGSVGVTLVEFLFAASIMAFVALGVAGMFPAAFRSVVVGGQVTKATILAQEMINLIRNESFDDLYQSPSSGNGYRGYSTFDTRNLPATCPSPVTGSCSNKKKWQSDLLADTAQTGGRGLPGGYGTVSVACMNVGTSSPYALTAGTCRGPSDPDPTKLLQVTVTVFWNRDASRSVNLMTYVARSE